MDVRVIDARLQRLEESICVFEEIHSKLSQQSFFYYYGNRIISKLAVEKWYYKSRFVHCHKFAPGTVTLTGDWNRGDDSKTICNL